MAIKKGKLTYIRPKRATGASPSKIRIHKGRFYFYRGKFSSNGYRVVQGYLNKDWTGGYPR